MSDEEKVKEEEDEEDVHSSSIATTEHNFSTTVERAPPRMVVQMLRREVAYSGVLPLFPRVQSTGYATVLAFSDPHMERAKGGALCGGSFKYYDAWYHIPSSHYSPSHARVTLGEAFGACMHTAGSALCRMHGMAV